jgi:anaerobic ribonucleoside-triphosphate reductase
MSYSTAGQAPQDPATSHAEIQLTDDERQPCEVWTRVMGYHRPVASFNIGKQGEHHERRFFAEQG